MLALCLRGIPHACALPALIGVRKRSGALLQDDNQNNGLKISRRPFRPFLLAADRPTDRRANNNSAILLRIAPPSSLPQSQIRPATIKEERNSYHSKKGLERRKSLSGDRPRQSAVVTACARPTVKTQYVVKIALYRAFRLQ